MINSEVIIDKMLVIDDTGMPKAPGLRQLLDRDVRELYIRDKTPDKSKYTAESIVIYYLGDPKSPARQSGLSEPEALKMAIEQAGLPKNYQPDVLVLHLIKRYYRENITEAGRVVENILQGIHNINLSISAMNNLLNEKLNGEITLEEMPSVIKLIDSLNEKAGEIPGIIKKLEEAKENLMYAKETAIARGGVTVSSSMNADDYQ